MDEDKAQPPTPEKLTKTLRHTQKKLQRLLQIGRIGFFEWNLKSDSLSCSGEFESLYGIQEGTFNCTREGWFAHVHPEDCREVERQLHRALETGTFRAEWRVNLPPGEVRWIEGRASILRGRDRSPTCMFGVHIDVTAQKKLEQQLNQTNMFLERIMQSVPSAIFVLDGDGILVEMNHAAYPLTGYECTEILQRPFHTLFSSDSILRLKQDVKEAVARQKPVESEQTLLRKGGAQRLIALSVAPLQDSGIFSGLVAVAYDITEQHDAEERLRKSEERYHTIFDAVNDGLFIHCARSGRILDVNRRAEEMFGYSRELMCALEVGQMSGEGFDQQKAMEVMSRVANAGPELFEWLGRSRDGRQFWVEVNLKKVVIEGEDRLLAVVREITDRKLATEALQQSEEKFRTLADNIAQFAWMADQNGNLFWFNKRWLDYTGTTIEEMMGEGWKKLQHPEHLDRVVEKMNHCFGNGIDWEDIMPLRGRNGEYRWFLSRAIPILDDNGKVIRWFGTNTDITEQRETEETLRRAEERLSLAQAAAGIGIWTWDLGSNEASFTDQYLAVLGVEQPPGSFEQFLALLHPDDRSGVKKQLEEALAEAKQFESQFRVTGRDGSERWIMGRGKVYCGAGGRPERVAGLIFDITDRKLAEENLKKAMEDLARSNRELEQFAYVASHDLKEPLRMVTSYLRLLEKKYKHTLDEKADQYINFAVDGAERMQKLIEGLLAYSRITARPVSFGPLDTNSIFDAAIANLETMITESAGVVTRGSLPTLRGDDTQILQLFQNLISNGLKYRKQDVPPRIEVTAHRAGMEWIFEVRDNGIGIAPHNFEKIFKLFHRLHSREEFEGTGIGLASCKKIVEHHHGRMWVESVPGHGSTFYFAIPL